MAEAALKIQWEPRYAFLLLKEHPYGRQMLQSLMKAGYPPLVVIQEGPNDIATEEREKFEKRCEGHPLAPPISDLCAGTDIEFLCAFSTSEPERGHHTTRKRCTWRWLVTRHRAVRECQPCELYWKGFANLKSPPAFVVSSGAVETQVLYAISGLKVIACTEMEQVLANDLGKKGLRHEYDAETLYADQGGVDPRSIVAVLRLPGSSFSFLHR
jgi:hypothetical protein